MTFREMLAIVVDRTPGALAGAIMGEDGLAVEEYAPRRGEIELATVAVEFQSVLGAARKVAGAQETAADLEELIVTTSRYQLLFRPLDDEYFLAVAFDPSGTLGKARYLVGTLLRDLRQEL
ncbi:MAG: hypothetical protein HRU00_16865 [Myxococcales bacterium]|nr:hypothetical protein [Myxococcales bacterium]